MVGEADISLIWMVCLLPDSATFISMYMFSIHRQVASEGPSHKANGNGPNSCQDPSESHFASKLKSGHVLLLMLFTC